MKILVIDVGGSHVKFAATDHPEKVEFVSGPKMTPAKMVEKVKAATKEWKYDGVSIGYPGPVVHGRSLREPYHLGPGWVSFDFKKAFGKPVKVVNDAAMQALGDYEGGRMLFLGLGTGLGSAMIVDQVIEPMELAHLPYKKGKSYEDYVGNAGLKRMGKKKWRHHVEKVVELLKSAVQADDVVIGGGNARLIKAFPTGTRMGLNENAFKGGFRLWEKPYNDFNQHRFIH